MMTVLTNSTEDFPKQTWDFPEVSGLEEWADLQSIGLKDAATLVSTYPYPDAVPPALRAEAEDELGR